MACERIDFLGVAYKPNKAANTKWAIKITQTRTPYVKTGGVVLTKLIH